MIAALAGAVLCGVCVFVAGLVHRDMHLWFFSYLAHEIRLRTNPLPGGLKHVLFCFVDHFEPLAAKASDAQGLERARRWARDYPQVAYRFRDADGRHPVHTFFYPAEEYREEHVAQIAPLCRAGLGEFEVHLHHHDDTPTAFLEGLRAFTTALADRHGLLVRAPNGEIPFAFIHGNWALDNSRADGRWCGLNNELILLRQAGCYADFTLPSAPSDTQTSTINSIYYATDDPDAPKSHNRGIPLRAGVMGSGDLLLIQGPLSLHWRYRKLGIWPRIENGDVAPCDIPIERRVDMWIRQHVHVHGRPDWIVVKVHTHGATEENADWLFADRGAGELARMLSHLDAKYNDGREFALHYVSARELYNIVKAAEAGNSGNPNQFRDFILPERQGSNRAAHAGVVSPHQA
jgi:hypothetical protein